MDKEEKPMDKEEKPVVAIAPALEVLDKFIGIAKELAKLPALVMPQYKSSAQDLYKICQKLLGANENLSRWLYRFLYFDFRQNEARTKFLGLVQEYNTMKIGPEFRQLKFSCGDIDSIYHENVASKLGIWFTDRSKLKEVQGIFQKLTHADAQMVALIYDRVVAKLDDLVSRVESHVNTGMMNDAEIVRLQFKADLRDVTERLEKFSGELSDLVIQFAKLAKVPVTL